MAQFKSYIYPVQGEKTFVEPADGKYFSYQEVVEIIGCAPDVVEFDDGRCMVYCGITEGEASEVNIRGSNLFHEHTNLYLSVVGDVLVTTPGMLGDWYDYDDEPDGDDYYDV